MRRFHAPALAIVIVHLLLGVSVGRAQSISIIGFDQVDWHGYGSAVNQNDSLWGRITYSYAPSLTTSYLNLTLSNSSSPTVGNLAIGNLPLFAVDNGDFSLRTEMVDLDLSALLGSAGINWANTFFRTSITPAPISPGSLSPVPHVPSTVGDIVRLPTDSPDEPPDQTALTDPGAPSPLTIALAAAKLIAKRDVKSVQEALNHCCAGSMARSIDWLNRKHGLNIPRTAQQIYDDLVAAGVSQPRPDGQPARTGWVSAKNNYARTQTNNQIETKVWDRGNEIGAIPGVTETTGGDFMAWLQGELDSGEDVELAYFFPGGAHIVTIVDAYTADGKLFVDYRDDESPHQGDPTKGDAAVKRGVEIFLTTPDGQYHFGAGRNTVYFAVSESYVPEPTAIATLAVVAVFGSLASRRRRAL